MKKIDMTTWKRRETYNNFIKYTNPTFSMGTRLDVTELLNYCKRENKKFFTTFLYIVAVCVNDVEELRTRILGEDVVVFDKVNPSYIVMLENEEISTCFSEMKETFDEFYECSRRDIEEVVKKGVASFNRKLRLDSLFISCVPWTDFTSIINPYNFDDKETTSIPRITWGKYSKNASGRIEMPIDVSAHHALLDGRQLSIFYEKMQGALLDPQNFLKGNYKR